MDFKKRLKELKEKESTKKFSERDYGYTREGFKILPIEEAKQKEKIIRYDNGVYVKVSAIPYDYNTAIIDYAVSDSTGNEFGRFKTFKQAKRKALQVEKIENPKEREKYMYD